MRIGFGCRTAACPQLIKNSLLVPVVITNDLLQAFTFWNRVKLMRSKCQLPVSEEQSWLAVTADQFKRIVLDRHRGHCDDVASAFIWAPGSELQSSYECTTSLMLALLLFIYPPTTHTHTHAFEPLQMLVRAQKSMHSNRDKRDLVLDNSGCLSLHYSLDRRDTVTIAATAEV